MGFAASNFASSVACLAAAELRAPLLPFAFTDFFNFLVIFRVGVAETTLEALEGEVDEVEVPPLEPLVRDNRAPARERLELSPDCSLSTSMSRLSVDDDESSSLSSEVPRS